MGCHRLVMTAFFGSCAQAVVRIFSVVNTENQKTVRLALNEFRFRQPVDLSRTGNETDVRSQIEIEEGICGWCGCGGETIAVG